MEPLGIRKKCRLRMATATPGLRLVSTPLERPAMISCRLHCHLRICGTELKDTWDTVGHITFYYNNNKQPTTESLHKLFHLADNSAMSRQSILSKGRLPRGRVQQSGSFQCEAVVGDRLPGSKNNQFFRGRNKHDLHTCRVDGDMYLCNCIIQYA